MSADKGRLSGRNYGDVGGFSTLVWEFMATDIQGKRDKCRLSLGLRLYIYLLVDSFGCLLSILGVFCASGSSLHSLFF